MNEQASKSYPRIDEDQFRYFVTSHLQSILELIYRNSRVPHENEKGPLENIPSQPDYIVSMNDPARYIAHLIQIQEDIHYNWMAICHGLLKQKRITLTAKGKEQTLRISIEIEHHTD